MLGKIPELLQSLINEHGSATILKERIAFILEQYAAEQRAHADLKAKHTALEAELQQERMQNQAVQQQLDALSVGGHATHVCDTCASSDLRRTGTRPAPTFGALGLKEAIYRCNACGYDSFFELPLS
jgi:rubrerythrin